MTLGQKIRAKRLERGLTQAQTAGERITRNMLSQIENDLAVPSMRTLEYLAAVLGVQVSWLVSEDEAGGTADRISRARSMLRVGEYAKCLELLQAHEDEADDEMLFIMSLASCNLARQAMLDEHFSDARELAKRAMDYGNKGLYASPGLQVQAAQILAASTTDAQEKEQVTEQYQQLHQKYLSGADYHLLMARHQLSRANVQAAEREIWSIAHLPDEHKAEYLILRGRIAIAKEQYENAMLYLQQAEENEPLPKILQRELYSSMEVCCRERGDFRQAYEYAAKQLVLTRPI